MRRHPWLVVSLLALLGVVVLGAFPVRAYVDQGRQQRQLADQARRLERANQTLVEEAARLQTDEVIEHLARSRYQLVRPGEEAYAILPVAEPAVPATPAPGAPDAKTAMPRSWFSPNGVP